jgi:hypothetical protein
MPPILRPHARVLRHPESALDLDQHSSQAAACIGVGELIRLDSGARGGGVEAY